MLWKGAKCVNDTSVVTKNLSRKLAQQLRISDYWASALGVQCFSCAWIKFQLRGQNLCIKLSRRQWQLTLLSHIIGELMCPAFPTCQMWQLQLQESLQKLSFHSCWLTAAQCICMHKSILQASTSDEKETYFCRNFGSEAWQELQELICVSVLFGPSYHENS